MTLEYSNILQIKSLQILEMNQQGIQFEAELYKICCQKLYSFHNQSGKNPSNLRINLIITLNFIAGIIMIFS